MLNQCLLHNTQNPLPSCSSKGLEQKASIFFFDIGDESVKYLPGCLCAWLQKCVFARFVDRDGDGWEAATPPLP